MTKARADRPNRCPTCKEKILLGEHYQRVTRYAVASIGERPTPGLGGNRLVEEVHVDCLEEWKENLYRNRTVRRI